MWPAPCLILSKIVPASILFLLIILLLLQHATLVNPKHITKLDILPSEINKYIALCNKGWHFWKGGFVTDKTGLKIFVFINAMIFAFTTFVTNTPLYGKIASKVWKIYFQYISPHFLDAAGSQISDLWLLLLSNSSLFSALMSHLPLLLLHSALVDNYNYFKITITIVSKLEIMILLLR